MLLAEVLQSVLNAGERWVLRHLVKYGAGHPCGIQVVEKRPRQVKSHQCAVGDQQRSAPTSSLELGGQLSTAAGSDQLLC